MIWVTSDSHWSHTNIIDYCNRPFNDVNHMNEEMVSRWNSVVKQDDMVYHLGDFCWRGDKPTKWLRRLNGRVTLILGNHDKRAICRSSDFIGVHDVFELKAYDSFFFLSHYAHRTWPRAFHGAYHLFGHSHGKLENYGKSMDVGVDTNNFYPYKLTDIIDKLKDAKLERHDSD